MEINYHFCKDIGRLPIRRAHDRPVHRAIEDIGLPGRGDSHPRRAPRGAAQAQIRT
jgi:hypothetical protein